MTPTDIYLCSNDPYTAEDVVLRTVSACVSADEASGGRLPVLFDRVATKKAGRVKRSDVVVVVVMAATAAATAAHTTALRFATTITGTARTAAFAAVAGRASTTVSNLRATRSDRAAVTTSLAHRYSVDDALMLAAGLLAFSPQGGPPK